MYLPTTILAVTLICCQAFEPDTIGWDAPIEVEAYPEVKQGGELTGFLNRFKGTMVHGDSATGVPILDPFQQKQRNINNEELIVIKGQLQNLRIANLSKYHVKKADFSSETLVANVRLQWDEIAIATNYNVTGKTPNNKPFWGKGTVSIVIRNAIVSVNTKLAEKNGKMAVSSLSMSIHLDKFYFKITGFRDSDLLSKIATQTVTALMPQWIEDNQKQVAHVAGQYVKNMLNNYLSHFTLKDFLNMIKN